MKCHIIELWIKELIIELKLTGSVGTAFRKYQNFPNEFTIQWKLS